MKSLSEIILGRTAEAPEVGSMTFRNTCRINVPEKVSMPDNPDGACGWQFANRPFAIPILGQPPEQRAIEVVQRMGRHLAEAHPAHLQACMMGSEVMKGFLVANSFHVSDPNAMAYLGQMRLQLLMGLQRPYIPDEHIRQKVAEVGNLTPENVFRLMAQMRDILCETQPQKATSPLVTP